ncbi:cuticle protein 19-like [Palaemon carinicauda]|uniref:cuticle protein 19-like n=1 Tax=Palaemon carinicauda TaxID=392227 RepID=UPI0035B5C4FF
MNPKVFIVLGLAAIAVADKRPFRPSTSYGPPQVSSFDRSFEGNSDESFEPAKYNFRLGVHDDSTSASFEHQEARDEDETQGSYTVQLPDGRRQTVKYFVNGDSGYVAEVTYEGEARYPDSDESREYSAPRAQRPRPSFSSFESQESREFFSSAPRTQRPKAQRSRPSFPRFDSLESREFFSAPSRAYGFPQ